VSVRISAFRFRRARDPPAGIDKPLRARLRWATSALASPEGAATSTYSRLAAAAEPELPDPGPEPEPELPEPPATPPPEPLPKAERSERSIQLPASSGRFAETRLTATGSGGDMENRSSEAFINMIESLLLIYLH
jgi:hypothetical protein